jgi:S1-C subfamily serine protease
MQKEELDQLAQAMGGVSILGCLPGSPADLAGLRYGDILLEVNGQRTPDLAAYIAATRDRSAIMAIRVFRGGQEQLLNLDIPERTTPPNPMELLSAVLRAGVLPGSVTPSDTSIAALNDDTEHLS